MNTRFPVLPLVLLLAGCGGHCATLAEVEVTDPDGVASADLMSRARVALRDFAAWTGRQGVCVDEIRFEAGLSLGDHAVLGRYRGHRIWLRPAPHELEDTVFHELCHALDAVEELSWGAPALFPPDALEGHLIDSDRARSGELFARACAAGPSGDLPPACAVEPDPVQEFVNERVYPAWAPDYAFAPLSFVRREVVGPIVDPDVPGLAPHPVVTGADALYVPRTGLDGGGRVALSFVRIDPATGEVTGEIAGPPVGTLRRFDVIGGAGDPLVVVVDTLEGTSGFAFRLAGDTLVTVPFPQGVDAVGRGAVRGDTALLEVLHDDRDRLWQIDLTDGAVTEVAPPMDAGELFRLEAGPGGLGGTWLGEDDEAWLARFDPVAGTWIREPWSGVIAGPAVPLPDGWLVRWGMPADLEGTEVLRGFGTVEAGVWRLDDPCASGVPADALFAVGDRFYTVEYAEAEPGESLWVPAAVIEVVR